METFINPPPDLQNATASCRPVAGDAATFVNGSLEYVRNLLETV